jgi:cytochrome c peroxidase
MRHFPAPLLLAFVTGCTTGPASDDGPAADAWPAVAEWTTLDLAHPDNYATPDLPAPYLDPAVGALDNSRADPITDAGATLGRVLFFDPRLSITDSISCASCHLPAYGFTDTVQFSGGHAGALLAVRTMRLANARWYAGPGFLWDRRAPTLEAQATQPMTHPLEMGWDPAHGGLDALLVKMQRLPYYPELFRWAWGSDEVTTERIRRSLAMYVRSIIAVRSRWDEGYAEVYDPDAPDKGLLRDLPTLDARENLGRRLFIATQEEGGFGCARCHVPPTFSLAADSRSNGITLNETVIFKAPSLKNVGLTGPYMHNGRFRLLDEVVAFYGGFLNPGPALDERLTAADGGQATLQIPVDQRRAVAAFLRTLSDTTTLADTRYRTPFRH